MSLKSDSTSGLLLALLLLLTRTAGDKLLSLLHLFLEILRVARLLLHLIWRFEEVLFFWEADCETSSEVLFLLLFCDSEEHQTIPSRTVLICLRPESENFFWPRKDLPPLPLNDFAGLFFGSSFSLLFPEWNEVWLEELALFPELYRPVCFSDGRLFLNNFGNRIQRSFYRDSGKISVR